MISERSCDTGDWSNDSALPSHSNTFSFKFKTENPSFQLH